MSRVISTTATATLKVPVVLTFTCPKCNQAATVSKFFQLSSQATVQGSNSFGASESAKMNLASSAANQIDLRAEMLEKGKTSFLMDESSRAAKKILCPHCGIRQIPHSAAGGQTLHPKRFALRLIGIFFAVLMILGAITGIVVRSNLTNQMSPVAAMVMELVAVLAVVGYVLYNRRQSQKAYSDPALAEKRYQSVVNDDIQATILAPGMTKTVNIR